jgi:hypothetical protein
MKERGLMRGLWAASALLLSWSGALARALTSRPQLILPMTRPICGCALTGAPAACAQFARECPAQPEAHIPYAAADDGVKLYYG